MRESNLSVATSGEIFVRAWFELLLLSEYIGMVCKELITGRFTGKRRS